MNLRSRFHIQKAEAQLWRGRRVTSALDPLRRFALSRMTRGGHACAFLMSRMMKGEGTLVLFDVEEDIKGARLC